MRYKAAVNRQVFYSVYDEFMTNSPSLHSAMLDETVESNRVLVSRVQKRDRAALETLYDRHAAGSVGLAYQILQDLTWQNK